MSHDPVRVLLSRVARRRAWAALGRAAATGLWCGLTIAAVAVLLDRLVAWGGWWTTPWGLTSILVGSVVAGAAMGWRRSTTEDAARAVDRFAATKDLFLSEECGGGASGSFAPVVDAQARAVAPTVRAGDVVPLLDPRRIGTLALGGGALAALVLWMPSLDLLGGGELRERQQQVRRAIEEQAEETEKKIAKLERKELEAKHSPEVEAAMRELENTFRDMKRPEPEKNDRKLAAQQKQLGEAWRKLREEGLKRLGQESSQKFGGARDTKAQKWRDEIKDGKTDAMQRELRDIAETAKAMAQSEDPVAREQLAQQLRDRIQALEEFSRSDAGTEGLKDALAKMQQALDQAQKQPQGSEAASEALAALQKAAQLSELEAEALAQMARDLQGLEQALDAARMARAANGEGSLDGSDCEGCQGEGDGEGEGSGEGDLEAYEKLYREMLAKRGGGAGNGQGMGGPGVGEGGIAETDPTLDAQFVPERARTHLTAGKILMEMSEERPGSGGEVERNADQAVGEVVDGAREAMLREEIPPAYHGAVQGYFDRLGKKRERNK